MWGHIGAAAGGTLGYMIGNTRGARYGAKLGRAYGKRKSSVSASTSRKRFKPNSVAKRVVKSGRKSYARPKYGTIGGRRYKRASQRRSGTGFSNAIAKTSSSNFSFGRGAKLYSGFKRAQLPTTFASTITQRIGAVSGNQAFGLLPTYRISQGANAEDTLAQSQFTIDGVLLDRAERWLQNYSNSAEAAAGTAQNSTTPARTGQNFTMKFICNWLKYDQAVRNMGTQDITVILYDCVLRSGVDPNTGSAAGSNSINVAPLADWQEGYTNEYNPSDQVQANAPGGQTTLSTTTATPFQSTFFCKLYKIRKVTKVVLAAGAVHHHYVTVKPRNMFDYQTLANRQNSNATYGQDRGQMLPGLSGFTILTACGSILGSMSNNTNITTGRTAVDCLTTATGSFSQYSRERRFHLRFDGLATYADLQGPEDDTDVLAADVVA